MCSKFFIRFFDILFSLILILLAFPVMFFVFIFSLVYMGQPVFFFQERIGYSCKVFTIYKFRTMVIGFEDQPGVSPYYYNFLRKSSLDELPQLFNILLGDMSFVGPRPLPLHILKSNLDASSCVHRSSIKPGLTGPSQVRSEGVPRSLINKYHSDVYYINNRSLFLYFKYLLQTPPVLIKRFINNSSGITL